MLVVITYDVNTETTAGRTRLRKVAKQCTNYGRRVQNSVFECILDSAQSVALKGILSDIIDKNKDSLRGLKSPFNFFRHCGQTVVPHEGTWIEISSSAQPGSSGLVVPHEGTWIEIVYGW